MSKIALYQEWPAPRYYKSGIVDIGGPTIRISVFPATKNGLKEAVKIAERKDSLLVKISHDYFDPEDLSKAVKKLVKAGKGIAVFQPIQEIPK